jgi:tripartite-type tricarboxylate transporter receptor subunit TctC
LIGLAPCGAAAQQGAQPTIRFIVGTAAGGVLDPYARLIADHMSKSLSRTIIVENKPGANGNISARMIVDAPANGTLVWWGRSP